MTKRFRNVGSRKQRVLVTLSPGLLGELRELFEKEKLDYSKINFSALVEELLEIFVDDCESGKFDLKEEFEYLLKVQKMGEEED